MALVPLDEMLAEMQGKDEHGAPGILTAADLREVRRVFRDYAFAYPKREGGHTVCSGCGEGLKRTVERAGDGIACPHCRKIVTVYEKWRGYKHLYQQMIVYTWHRSKKHPETIYAKAIHAEKMFWAYGNPENAGMNAHVAAIYQFSPKGAKMYRYNRYHGGFYPNASSITPEENKHGYNCEGVHANFGSETYGTELGFVAGALEYAGRAINNPIIAMTEAARKPYLKHVIMQGQQRLAQDLASHMIKPEKRTAKRMPELLGITEGQWYEAKRDKILLSADMMKAMQSIQRAGKMEITFREVRAAMDANRTRNHTFYRLEGNADALLGDIPPKLRRKAVRRAIMSPYLNEWIDYWKQLKELNEDMTDTRMLLPKDMHAMHQRMTDRINAIQQQKKLEMDAMAAKAFSDRFAELRKKYEFEACGLILRPFESAKEVIDEGIALHICIGGYAQRYIKGETILCALRRAEAPEEPWRAIEFSAMTGKLVQDRGAYNDRGTGEGNFSNGVEGWLKRFWAAFDARKAAENRRKQRDAA